MQDFRPLYPANNRDCMWGIKLTNVFMHALFTTHPNLNLLAFNFDNEITFEKKWLTKENAFKCICSGVATFENKVPAILKKKRQTKILSIA